MLGHGPRLPIAILATVVAAGAATLLLRPRGGLIEPDAVHAGAYFSRSELERAREFRRIQRLLALLGLGVSGGTMVVLVARPPRRLLERAGGRPVIGAAGAGAGAAIAIALARRFPRGWWAPAAVVVVAVGVLTIYLSPVLIDPLFNRFERLPEGRLRSDVLTLARKAHVKVGEVYRVDASRRTTGANAYVGGIGPTKRVVLYDNLIERFPEDQVRSVLAHELGHVRHRDVPRGLLWLAVVAPAGTYLLQRIAGSLPGTGLSEARGAAGPAALPALALSFAVVSFALGTASNLLSRRIEASADAFSLRLTGDPAAFIGLERRLAVRNVTDPDPPRIYQLLFGTHPTTVERIGFGEAFARAH